MAICIHVNLVKTFQNNFLKRIVHDARMVNRQKYVYPRIYKQEKCLVHLTIGKCRLVELIMYWRDGRGETLKY